MAEVENVGQADAVLLAPLTEDTFLHNLHARYKRDIIYTYVGEALVSVNPCRPLPLYSPELVREYLARAPHTMPPHIYAITATAYRWVRDRNESQCIVITGESGAGKTEAARVCLQCAVVAGGGGRGGRGAALPAAGTLLEAFGNAATQRNYNASRFGKLLEIEFDFKGEPVGGHITQYLLEKERACGAPEGERNFHVLYQLLAGAEPQLLQRLRLQRDWRQYRVLRGAPPTPPPPHASPRRPPARPASPSASTSPSSAPEHADRDHFAYTMAAMRALGFSAEERDGVLRLVAFLLKLGNVEFEPQHNIDGTIGARLHHAYELTEACALVGVDAPALAAALGAAPADADDAGDADGDWAAALRDRLVCALYSRLFTWLITAVNAAIEPAEAGKRRALGVLDVYGFECLERNGLERLLINYAAERVQAAVTGATLRREQELYRDEGLPWRPLPYLDHELCAEPLDAGPASVLGALREATARREGDAGFLRRLQRRRHPRLLALPPDRFRIEHFAGAVVYSARGLVAHNRDEWSRGGACGVLAAARDPLLAALFAPRTPHAGRAPPALACRQRALVAALVRRVGDAPRLVRCLRAAPALRPRHADPATLRRQLRDQGLLDMALLRRAGWCHHVSARAALARYSLLAPALAGAEAARDREQPVVAARRLLRALPIPSSEFAYGHTRVFIRSPRTVWELEALREARVEQLVVAAQRAWRAHRQRARRLAAAAIIARAWRRHRARRVASPVSAAAAARAALAIWRWWCAAARRRYLAGLWRRLPPRHSSPACGAWPACGAPRLLGAADALLRRLHHAWRCRLYRAAFDQPARNRMREKVTASALFRERKLSYARSVAHPFAGDYVRLRAAPAWRRAAPGADRCVVFADLVGKVARSSGRVARRLAVVSTAALLLLDARTLRVKRRVPAHRVHRLSLSPYDDDLLVVHVRPCAAEGCAEAAWPSAPHVEHDAHAAPDAADAAGCLFGAEGARRRRGDLVVRAVHALELATKLFLVVQHAAGVPPHVTVAAEFEADFGQQPVTVAFHAGAGGGGGGAGGVRLLRRGSRMDVLL